jgi:hypothetical protein
MKDAQEVKVREVKGSKGSRDADLKIRHYEKDSKA